MLVIRVRGAERPRPRVILLHYSADSKAVAAATYRSYRTPPPRRGWMYDFKVWRCEVGGNVAQVRSRRSPDWEPSHPPLTFDELITGTLEPLPRFNVPNRPGRRRYALATTKSADGDTSAQIVQFYDLEFHLPHIYAVLVRSAKTNRTTTVVEWTSRMKSLEKITLHPSGTQVAVLVGKIVHVWSVADGEELAELKFGLLRPEDVTFSPDGRTLAVVVQDGLIFYDTSNWAEARRYSWGVGKLHSIAIAPDHTTAAVGTQEGEVVVFDLE